MNLSTANWIELITGCIQLIATLLKLVPKDSSLLRKLKKKR
jgi:hypothetical protein